MTFESIDMVLSGSSGGIDGRPPVAADGHRRPDAVDGPAEEDGEVLFRC
jgi:hypothetical protein